jgi:hypothetical protein
MGKIAMKGSTPVGSAPLCRSCSHAHILAGYRESEMVVVCQATYPDIPVPFIVRECSGFNDRAKPDWEQMKKLAIHVTRPIRSSRNVGFNGSSMTSPAAQDSDDDSEDCDD